MDNLARAMHEIAKMMRNDSEPELLPCPFCQSKAIYAGTLEDGKTHEVCCSGCPAMMRHADKGYLFEQWNRRVPAIDCAAANKDGQHKCLGYANGHEGDEPIEQCKTCTEYTSFGLE